MDKNWMSKDRLSKEYRDGVDRFINYALEVADNPNYIHCPCRSCGNLNKLKSSEIKHHLFMNGIDVNYKRWIWHGEKVEGGNSSYKRTRREEKAFDDSSDHLVDMVMDANDDINEENFIDQDSQEFSELLEDAEKPIYPGSKFKKLFVLVKLFNLKARSGCSDSIFTELLCFLKDLLPNENHIPTSTYRAKKTLSTLGMGYEKIHACPNDCILYRKEFENENQCPTCQVSRWKPFQGSNEEVEEKKRIPAKTLWYLSPIPRFKRLFRNPNHAKNLRWHHEERIDDGKLRHPADSLSWKKIDDMWPNIRADPRNLRLGLSADGINPFSNLSSSYSCWPVLLVIYNLPPELCMKRRFTMLVSLIPGRKQPGNDIDVYLSPLIDDLKRLWSGIECFDAYKNESFMLRGLVLWTISDFPAYGNLSGCTTKGYYACPICGDKTPSERLKHSRKECYMRHRRFLNSDHPFRRQKKAFNGEHELEEAPKPLSGEEVYQKICGIQNNFGKLKEKVKVVDKDSNNLDGEINIERLWKKKSIFFELEYWKFLLIRNNLDFMHIEKNVCESLLATLFNIPGKSKDGLSARLDIQDMGLRKELAPDYQNNRVRLPPACFALKKNEKREICSTLANVKVPSGYSSNIRSLVSMKDLRLVGLKSHDCHALMQQVLPCLLISALDKHVRDPIIRLCFFFNAICAKVIDPSKLEKLQEEIVIILCLFEKCFLPPFFDIMVHLTVHLVREIQLCGPISFRWMYPFERFMKILKGYVKNRNRPEGCIVECYIAEEAIEFCSEYIADVEPIVLPKSCSNEYYENRGLNSGRLEDIEKDEWNLAHRTVLENRIEVQPYIEEHLHFLRTKNTSKSQKWVHDEHHKTFIMWFKDKVESLLLNKTEDISSNLRQLSMGPTFLAVKHDAFFINGRRFNTKSLDDMRVHQNSGVTLVAKTMQFASSKDQSPAYANMTFYGVILEIWELDYREFRIPIFKCKWAESNNGVKNDKDTGLTLVDLNREGHKNDPFIMAIQAKQLFYIPIDSQWSVALSTQPRSHVYDDGDVDDDVFGEFGTFEKELDDSDDFETLAGPSVREDGDDIWIERPKNISN